MKAHHLSVLAVAFALLWLAPPVRAQQPEDPGGNPVAGIWQGTLEVGIRSLEVALHVQRGDGGYEATFDSLTQGAKGIPVSSFSFSSESGAVTAETRSAAGPLRRQAGGG